MTTQDLTNRTTWTKDEEGNDVAYFKMRVSGGKLPKNFEAYINVRMSFKGTTFEQIRDFIAGGMSARVVLARTLRENLPKEKIEQLSRKGLNIHVLDVGKTDAFMDANDRAAIVRRYLESLPEDVRNAALAQLQATSN